MIRRQFLRFVVVGLVSNAALYGMYLLLARGLLEPTLAMTATYITGVGIGFLGNRRWSFEHTGPGHKAFVRYVISYAVGYLMNLAILEYGVAVLGLRHEYVQGAAIIFVALFLFLLQKYYVFAHYKKSEPINEQR